MPNGKERVRVDGRELVLTNLEKIMYPETGTTKADILAYYAAVAHVLIPAAANRPATRKRWVNGVGTAEHPGEVFFQKNLEDSAPGWLPRAAITHKDRTIQYPLVNDPATLTWLAQIAALERQRDAVLDEAAPGDAERMIQRLVRLRGIGVQSATLLVREAFVRPFANGKALGAYAGLSPTPYSSGGTEREQGIGRAGNARLRTVLVELAWIWQRYQPGSAIVGWFRDRLGGAARRLRKVMVVALARKLLIALWRFATQGVVPEGASLKPAA